MNLPISDLLKSIPGLVGIRLEEELPYKIIKSMDDIELRHYEPFTLARTRASSSDEKAENECFRRLAEFIYGKNDSEEKISMTTPVFIDRDSTGGIVMSFYIPESSATLTPKDSKVTIEHMPEKTVAAYRFSGNIGQEEMATSETKLRSRLSDLGLTPVSRVWWAIYDQPFSVPVMKRNEALVCVKTLS